MSRIIGLLCILFCMPLACQKSHNMSELSEGLAALQEEAEADHGIVSAAVDDVAQSVRGKEEDMDVVRFEVSQWRDVKPARQAFEEAEAAGIKRFHLVFTEDISHSWLFAFGTEDSDIEVIVEGKGEVPIVLSGISFSVDARRIEMKNLVIAGVVRRPILSAYYTDSFEGETLIFRHNEKDRREFEPVTLVSLTGLSREATAELSKVAFFDNRDLDILLDIRGKEEELMRSIVLKDIFFFDNRSMTSVVLDKFAKAKLENLRVRSSGTFGNIALGRGDLYLKDSAFENTQMAVRALRPSRNEVRPVHVENVYMQRCDERADEELLPAECCEMARPQALDKDLLKEEWLRGDFK